MIEKKIFGYINGEAIYEFIMTNKHGMKVSCISHGAKLKEIIVPDKNGKLSNVLLGFDNLEDYVKDASLYLCAAIGRVAGRIENGEFEIKGKQYNVPQNEGKNTLHGGGHGFNTLDWDSKIEETEDSSSVTFYKTIPSEEDGFPGKLKAEIIYTINENNDLSINFKGLSDKDTLFNPTVHSYFNLNNDVTKLLSDHTLQINASEYAELDTKCIPTGKLKEVSGTPFDFREAKNLPEAIKKVKEQFGVDGFDHPFKLNSENSATLINEENGRRLDIKSDRNALIVYTLNSVNGDWTVQNEKVIPNMGIALEPQTLPDAVHHKDFGDIVLQANETKEYAIKYHFSVVK